MQGRVSILKVLCYLFCCSLLGNAKLVSPILARWGGGEPGCITGGSRWRTSRVGLGCSTIRVGMIRSRGRCARSSGVGGFMSIVIVTGEFKRPRVLLISAVEVVVVSVGVVLTSVSIRSFSMWMVGIILLG